MGNYHSGINSVWSSNRITNMILTVNFCFMKDCCQNIIEQNVTPTKYSILHTLCYNISMSVCHSMKVSFGPGFNF